MVRRGSTVRVRQRAFHLKPGKYALYCFISDRKGGPPHITKGTISEATVE
jgi:hypothetical protein